ncbi:MAG: response regulator transcription factor [Acidobacteriaceae bacterium]|jgi:DNA-binding NarL/FixJ family response regulator|nr:response regulator transcription factor [Acidobacteriaceae bacterium]
MTTSIRIVLADDHTVIRQGLRLLLERHAGFQVVGEAADGREALDVVGATTPDVAVLDIAMPNLNGIEAARQIANRFPSVAIVVLSMHADESYLLQALKVGARAYLLKDSADTDLIAAIRAVTEGKAFFSPAISRLLADDYVHQLRERGVQDSYELLTPREREILQLLAEGKSNKAVATLLNLSPFTVDTHRNRLMQKLNLHSAPELVLYAVRKGIIS